MTIDIDPIRKREQAASGGPWFYDSYSGVFSTPKVALWDPWLDTVDDSHSMERHGRCDACGKDGCSLFSEAYNRDPLVAHVPAHHGDTAIGVHAADAVFIAYARTDVPALCDEIERLREQVFAQRPVIEAAEAWAQAREVAGSAIDSTPDGFTAVNALHDAVEQYRLMDVALASARDEAG